MTIRKPVVSPLKQGPMLTSIFCIYKGENDVNKNVMVRITLD